MSIIVAFFCGMCFATLADSIADYISACAERIEAQAEAIRVENKSKSLALDKQEQEKEKANTAETPE